MQIKRVFGSRMLQTLAFATVCIVGSFVLGIETAGEIEPFAQTNASTLNTPSAPFSGGDIDGNGTRDLSDVLAVLAMVQGQTEPTERQREEDPDGDGILTMHDALLILQSLDGYQE